MYTEIFKLNYIITINYDIFIFYIGDKLIMFYILIIKYIILHIK